MTTIPNPQTPEEVTFTLKQFASYLSMFSDNGWGAHWMLIHSNTGKHWHWMSEHPELKDSFLGERIQEMHDLAERLEALRNEVIEEISSLIDNKE